MKMNYGLCYMGSKSAFSNEIIDILPKKKHFYDLFHGGGAVTHSAILSKKYDVIIANDINPMIQSLLINSIKGLYDNRMEWVSRERFCSEKDSDEFIKYLWSFSAKGTQYLYAKEIEPLKKAVFYARNFNDVSLFAEMGILLSISRKCKAQTLFGSIMDTIADKVLCVVLIVCIASKSPVLLVMLLGEIIIATINFVGTLNNVPIVAIMTGKAKMWALAFATLFGYMYYFGWCDEIYVTITGIIVITMQVLAILEYGGKIIRKSKDVKKEKIKFKRGAELKYALFDTDYYLSTIDVPILKKLTVE